MTIIHNSENARVLSSPFIVGFFGSLNSTHQILKLYEHSNLNLTGFKTLWQNVLSDIGTAPLALLLPFLSSDIWTPPLALSWPFWIVIYGEIWRVHFIVFPQQEYLFLGTDSISNKTSYRKISQILEGVRSVVKILVTLCHLSGASAAVLPKRLSHSRAFGKL